MSKGVGRPPKFTPEVVRKLLVSKADGGTVTDACATTGISRETYYANVRKGDEFVNDLHLFNGNLVMHSKRLMIARIANGDVAAAKWWLRKKCPEEFGV